VRDMQLRDLSADIALHDGRLEVSKLAAKLYEGSLTGGFSATADQALAAQIALDKVAVEPFMRALIGQAYLSGTLASRIDLRTQGATVDEVARALDGRVTWQVRDGAVHGISASQSLEDAAAVLGNVLKGQPGAMSNPFEAGRRTAFSTFDGRVDF